MERLARVGTLVIAVVAFGGCASNGGSYGHSFGGGPRGVPTGPSVDEIIDRAEAERERMAEEMRARHPTGWGGGMGRRQGF